MRKLVKRFRSQILQLPLQKPGVHEGGQSPRTREVVPSISRKVEPLEPLEFSEIRRDLENSSGSTSRDLDGTSSRISDKIKLRSPHFGGNCSLLSFFYIIIYADQFPPGSSSVKSPEWLQPPCFVAARSRDSHLSTSNTGFH